MFDLRPDTEFARRDGGRENTSTVAENRAQYDEQPDGDDRATKRRKTGSTLARRRGREGRAEACQVKTEPPEGPSGEQHRVEHPTLPFPGAQTLGRKSLDKATEQTGHKRRAPRPSRSAQDPAIHTRLGVGSCDATQPQGARKSLDIHNPRRRPNETPRTLATSGRYEEEPPEARSRLDWKSTVGIPQLPVPVRNPAVPPVPAMVRPTVPRPQVYVIFKHSNGVEGVLALHQSFSALTLMDIFGAVLRQAKVDLNGTNTESILYTLEGPGISDDLTLRCLQRRNGPQRSWFDHLEHIKGRMMQRVTS